MMTFWTDSSERKIMACVSANNWSTALVPCLDVCAGVKAERQRAATCEPQGWDTWCLGIGGHVSPHHEHLDTLQAPLAPLRLVVVIGRLLNGHIRQVHVCGRHMHKRTPVKSGKA